MAGYPLVTVPCGVVDGLPVGAAFSGGAGSESVLLRIADAYEVAVYGPAGSAAGLGDPFAGSSA
jgi:amidase